ncbi:hypothetical protein IscW_ISCW020882 [Ixodes scapularis]|uniref:Uncharacterized protein n=1 Tax=Ixodes scapularis TaxID=6945 RepID=B7Q7M5_IXOSC|nr:hypothetical protein IscW_ISCW020882 [Ixodes scapularis]|eukprot:XP_002404220.1 hypothetical protein IscW_ISCW020882 [Ixodes scapularis]
MQEVLVYKLERFPSGKEAYALLWQQTVSHPILSLRYLDIMGDGACELLVLSTKGLHILQVDLDSPVSAVQFFEDGVFLPIPEFLENGESLRGAGVCDQFDSVTCGCIADIDMDGENEVILGTYGQG